MIRIRAVSFDETRFYGNDVRELARVFDVHIYSPDNVNPSPIAHFFELPWLFTELRFKESVSAEEKENFDFDFTIPSEWRFLPVTTVHRLPFVDCGTFRDINAALKHLRVHRPEVP